MSDSATIWVEKNLYCWKSQKEVKQLYCSNTWCAEKLRDEKWSLALGFPGVRLQLLPPHHSVSQYWDLLLPVKRIQTVMFWIWATLAPFIALYLSSKIVRRLKVKSWDVYNDFTSQSRKHFAGESFFSQLLQDVLTWRHPVSAAQGSSAEPPSWPSRPQTLVSSPPALCTAPPSSFSFARGVAPAEGQKHVILFHPKMLFGRKQTMARGGQWSDTDQNESNFINKKKTQHMCI